MIPIGYMAKRISPRPDWLKAPQVVDIYSVSGCISQYFANYIPYWKHNGYWLFDSPESIRTVAQENALDLSGLQFFYYEVHELEYDEETQEWFELPSKLPFETHVQPPSHSTLAGYDLVSFESGTNAGCSPLSCNHVAESVPTNSHCLLSTFEEAQHALLSEQFKRVEPGPYRIIAVYRVEE